MSNWLQKILTPPAKTGATRGLNVRPGSGNLPGQPRSGAPIPPAQGLPNATVIYGIGAAFMFVATFFLLLAGRWFPAFIVLALGACLVGFALHLLKHQD